MGDLTLCVGPPANGGSCVARHDGRVVFVRYALPGETVRARITAQKDAFWQAEAVAILEPSPDRIAPLCPIAGPGGAGCCDLAFAEPEAARILKGQVVANQLDRIAGYGPGQELRAEPLSAGDATGWRTRVRMKVGFDGRAGYHRYRSSELVAAPDCGQLQPGMLGGVADRVFPPGAE
ncbi:MAG: TRAM domain-containing protein, partial [Mycobacteriaceae bacterium]|nr:TRAM domain-containing protein [Mycobacteriaceae bacterium]